LEALFPRLVPLKSSVIHNTKKDKKDVKDDAPPVASSYAFVKYTDEADAVASKKLNHAMLQVSPTEKVQVELASAAAQKSTQQGVSRPESSCCECGETALTTAAAAASSKEG
jgi:hypothetical protein